MKQLLKSFKHAVVGFGTIFKSERNFRIEIVIAMLVLFLAAFLQVDVWQWVVLVLMVVLVLILEMVNTVFELLVDMLKPRVHHYVKDIKNIMAAMVLIAAVSAIIVGLLIFVPYFF